MNRFNFIELYLGNWTTTPREFLKLPASYTAWNWDFLFPPVIYAFVAPIFDGANITNFRGLGDGSCSGNCSNNGVCYNKKCYCFEGSGSSCSIIGGYFIIGMIFAAIFLPGIFCCILCCVLCFLCCVLCCRRSKRGKQVTKKLDDTTLAYTKFSDSPYENSQIPLAYTRSTRPIDYD